MVVRSQAQGAAPTVPAEFTAAVASMRSAPLRPEIFCEEMPAPQRIAPHSFALSADVTVDDLDIGTGRLILMHDPVGNDAWAGCYRCVAYVRAEIDPELGTDPMLGEVAWTWLIEALTAHQAEYVAASGTVTRVHSEAFGQMSESEPTSQVEIRASWTPLVDDAAPDLTAHVEAWGELLCTSVGLPPVPEGVTPIPSRRGQRGR